MNKQETKLCIVGTGGFGRETLTCYIDSIKASNINYKESAVFMVDDEYYTEKNIMNTPVIPFSKFKPDLYTVVIAVGDPIKREEIAKRLPPETSYGKVIHPSAVISEWVKLGEGAIVTAGVILTCNITVGKHAHFNLHTTVGHDCKIGDFFTSAPAVNISGSCTFGNKVYMGTNSSIREGIKLTDEVTIGMGGVVVKNISEPGIYVGSPVQRLQKK